MPDSRQPREATFSLLLIIEKLPDQPSLCIPFLLSFSLAEPAPISRCSGPHPGGPAPAGRVGFLRLVSLASMRIAHQRDPKKKPFMLHSLIMSSTFAAFLIASTILAVTPGPGVIYVVTRTLSRGRQAGLASVAGIALGNLANATAASLGLAALLAASATAFAVMKLAGAAYLVFLGIRALRSKPIPAVPLAPARAGMRLFADGFLVALLNP